MFETLDYLQKEIKFKAVALKMESCSENSDEGEESIRVDLEGDVEEIMDTDTDDDVEIIEAKEVVEDVEEILDDSDEEIEDKDTNDNEEEIVDGTDEETVDIDTDEETEDIDTDEETEDKDIDEDVGGTDDDEGSVDSSSDDDGEESMDDLLVESEQTCNICSKTIGSVEYFQIHQRLHQQGKLNKVSEEPQSTRKEAEKPVATLDVGSLKVKVEKATLLRSTLERSGLISAKNGTSVSSSVPKPSTSGNVVQKTKTKIRDNVDDLLVEGPRVCKFCGKTFYSMDYYRIHQRVHVSEKLKHIPLKPSTRLSSHYSGGKFPSARTEGHQVISVYPQVGVMNNTESSMNHTKLPPTKKCCVCDVCSLTFPNYRSLTLHKKVHRKGLCTVYPLYICSVCNRGFVSKSSFLNHCAYHGAKPWTCNICGMTFSKKMYLGMHKSSKHVAKKRVELKCSECEKTFDKEKDLRRHERLHESQKEKLLQISCMCSLCDKMLPLMTTNELRIHMGVHFGEVLKCHICPDIFYRSQEFKRHMDRHLGL